MSILFVPVAGHISELIDAKSVFYETRQYGRSMPAGQLGWLSFPPVDGPLEPNHRAHGLIKEILNEDIELPLGPVAIGYQRGDQGVPSWDVAQQEVANQFPWAMEPSDPRVWGTDGTEEEEAPVLDEYGVVLWGFRRTCAQAGWDHNVFMNTASVNFLSWLSHSDWAGLLKHLCLE